MTFLGKKTPKEPVSVSLFPLDSFSFLLLPSKRERERRRFSPSWSPSHEAREEEEEKIVSPDAINKLKEEAAAAAAAAAAV